MSNAVIRVENLGKRYRIGEREPFPGLRHVLNRAISAPFRVFKARKLSSTNGDPTHIWALKDVSFDVRQGEVVGIIGRNGAGKTTLLKILARVTKPTTGFAEVRGRMGSLLEVGTGFHPELTGRENVFLSGAILGMGKAEIQRKFDEIVAFSEVEKFIDTPIKHYSSGMQMRLAFAVAAHLEPEMLLVDEVLAVGDVAFQKKCLGKMGEIAGTGRTVLFVSHSMPAVTRLCPRTILMDKGGVLCDGPTHEVVRRYLSSGLGTTAAREWTDRATCPGNQIVCLRAVRVRASDGRVTETIDIREPVGIEMEYEVLTPNYLLVPNYHFYNEEGTCVFAVHDWSPEWRRTSKNPGHYRSTVWIPGNYLSEGSLIVGTAVSTYDPFTVHFYQRDAVAFQVVDSLDGDSARGDYAGHMPGVVRPLLEVKTDYVPSQMKQADPVR
jgi:lipopolysaccharide transport system ATP-binding protein